VAVQAGWVQLIIARDLIARLTRGKPSVNFSPLDMLACAALSRNGTQPYSLYDSLRPLESKPEISRYAQAIPQPYRDGQLGRHKFL
jgi:hypothetical protein